MSLVVEACRTRLCVLMSLVVEACRTRLCVMSLVVEGCRTELCVLVCAGVVLASVSPQGKTSPSRQQSARGRRVHLARKYPQNKLVSCSSTQPVNEHSPNALPFDGHDPL